MRKLFFIILILLISSTVFPQSQKELLYKAYQDSSYELLVQFFENWRLEKTPITDEEYENLTDVQKDVYDLFYEFYNPFNLKERRSVYNVVIYPKIDYRIIETVDRDSLFLLILRDIYNYDLDTVDLSNYDENRKKSFTVSFESHLPTLKRDSIINFRPRVKFNNAGVLYYSNDYDSLLSEFISSDSLPLNSHDSEAVIYTSIVSKYFLYPYIYIRRNLHGDLIFLTNPIIPSIVFDRYRTKAKIIYFTYDESRYALYKKVNSKWKIIGDFNRIMY